MRMRTLLVALALLSAAQPALAGRMWQWGENAKFPTDSNGATMDKMGTSGTAQQATRAGSMAGCVSIGCKFHMPLVGPGDIPLTATVKMHHQVPNSSNGDCFWTVGLTAVPSGTNLNTNIPTGTTQVVSTTGMTAFLRKITAASSAIPVYNAATAANCAGVECQNMDLVAVVIKQASSTATVCDARMLEAIY